MLREFMQCTGAILIAAFMAVGCATTQQADGALSDLEHDLEARTVEVSELKGSVNDLESELAGKDAELKKQHMAIEQMKDDAAKSQPTTNLAAATGSALPNAKAGECYAKVWVPPVYATEEVKVLKREASERIDITPAQYEWVDDKVLVKESSTKLEVIPATYKWVEEEVMVKPAAKDVIEVPATYDYVEEKVLDTAAHTIWKKGRGAIEKVDNATGEIICLIEVPATYKTVKKRVLKTAATTKESEIPAEYETVKRRIVDTPATTREVEIPAEYKGVKIRKLTKDEDIKRIPIEAEYTTITKRSLVSEGKMEWLPVMCETNMRMDVISELQRTLKSKGHNPGPIDGIYGSQTGAAVRSFQEANELPTGGLTIRTLEALGIKTGS